MYMYLMTDDSGADILSAAAGLKSTWLCGLWVYDMSLLLFVYQCGLTGQLKKLKDW